jgi:tRNA (adenine22-N1)-methyltransferase
MHGLSERLSLIAEMAGRGESVCDVGTDHGFLAAYFSKNKKFDRIFATDIGEKPLENARNTLEKLGICDVNLVLCDGLSGVCDFDIKTVIIAGMGGEVIRGIISRAPFLKNEDINLILQPMTAADKLRRYLFENGFFVKEEKAVFENNKIYSVMKVGFDGALREADPLFLKIGILKPDSEANLKYIEKQIKIAQKCADELKGVGAKRKEYLENLSLCEGLRDITEG